MRLRPPNESDQHHYLCHDLEGMNEEELGEADMEAQKALEEAKRVSSMSWWAFRRDEIRKRLWLIGQEDRSS